MARAVEELFDLPTLLSILNRQFRLMSGIGLVIMSCALLYIVQTTPLYTATALVRVDPQEKNLLDPATPTRMSSSSETTRIETEVEILKSPSLALATIALEELQTTPEFGPRIGIVDKFKAALGLPLPPAPSGEDLVSQARKQFSNALMVRRKALTFLIAIEFTAKSPKLAARVANQHAQAYIHAQITSRVEASLAARDMLRAQLAQARDRLSQSNQALQVYIEQNAKRLANELGSAEISDLAEELQAATLSLEAGKENLLLARHSLDQDNWPTLTDNLGDTALQSLLTQRQTLANRLHGKAIDQAEAYDLAEGLAAVNQQIKTRGQLVIADLQQNVSQTQDTRKTLIETLQGAVLLGDLSAQTLADIYELQQEAQIAQRQYDQLISRMRDVEAQSVLQMASSRLVSKANIPVSATYPDKELVIAIAALLAVGLGVSAALLKEFYFGGVTSLAQLDSSLPLKVSTAIPKIGLQSDMMTVADEIITNPMSEFSEAFRRLRASINQGCNTKTDQPQVILVTSAGPTEGKSTTALALARTYAQAGMRTLLIDADLRNPSLFRFLGENPDYGLLDYLQDEDIQSGTPASNNQKPVAEFYVMDHISQLGLILGGQRANTPTDAILQSKMFHDLIADARANFDIIVIDTAPLLPVVDTQYIAPLVDTAVICLRFAKTGQLELKTAHTQLSEVLRPNASLISVLGFFEAGRPRYGFNNYYS